MMIVLSTFCVLEAKSPASNFPYSDSEPLFYSTRKGHVTEVICVLPQGTAYSASLKADLRQVLDRALQTFGQAKDDVMILKIHDAHDFEAQTCWARVLVKQKGARQTWWVKSPQVPEEPDWSEALGFSQNHQKNNGFQ